MFLNFMHFCGQNSFQDEIKSFIFVSFIFVSFKYPIDWKRIYVNYIISEENCKLS